LITLLYCLSFFCFRLLIIPSHCIVGPSSVYGF
jgi:hypothetical protein